MPISFQCPQCGKKLKAPDNAVGKSSKCPGCGGTVTCPEPIYDAEVVEPSSAPAPDLEFDDSEPYGKVDLRPVATPSAEDRRPCPMCGESIVATAAQCRYCGEIFDPALKRANEKNKFAPGDTYLSTGDKVVAVLCSGIGCIMGLVWMIQGKPKGMKMFGLSILVNFIAYVIGAVFGVVLQQMRIQGGP